MSARARSVGMAVAIVMVGLGASPAARADAGAGGAVGAYSSMPGDAGVGQTPAVADAGVPAEQPVASCTEHVPEGKARPELREQLPARGTSGYAAVLEVVVAHGKGETVGPDITRNGRASFAQLLSNVFDPNLVIGSGYQAQIIITDDGRSLSGLLVEESPDRVVLKLQGGKIETIPRQEIDEQTTSPLSLMPEDWDKQIPPDELIDLLEYITCEESPVDNHTRRIPGTPR